MRRTILRLVPGMLVVLVLATCTKSGGAGAPGGLEGVVLPSDEATVTRVLEAMPTTVSGRERSESYDPLRVSYGQGNAGLRALPLGEAAEAEGFPATAGEYLRMLADGGEIEIQTQRLDPGSDLVYLVATTTSTREGLGGEMVGETTEFVIGWGDPDSEWLFAISADSRELRLALLEAFVDSVRSST